MIGQTFHRLKVVGVSDKKSGGHRLLTCSCECGAERYVRAHSLRSGVTKSCGCLHKEVKRVHGLFGTDEYNVYNGMMQRCNNTKHPSYSRYGGRGIKVCDRWLESPLNFLSDMGERPDGLSLDRIDNDGDYEPSNCRWATWEEQARNKSTNRLDTQKVKGIKSMIKLGLSNRLISRVYGLHRASVNSIRNEVSWVGV